MIKSYSIVIEEVDDAEFALRELNTQLSEIKLLKNTVGIVSVNKEFVSSGVYGAVAKALPFPLAGITSFSQAVNGKTGTYLFSIMVLTSDTCEFACGLSDEIPMQGSVAEITQKCYKSLRSKLTGEVKLALLYLPIFRTHYPNQYVKAISEIDERVPVFGTLPNGEIMDIHTDAKITYGSELYNNCLSMILISGEISPSFYVGSATKESVVLPNIGVVTAAEGNYLKEINNESAVGFFERMKFKITNQKQISLTSFLMDEKDEKGNIISSVTKVIMAQKDGGYVLASGVKVGSNVSIVNFTDKVVMETAKEVVEKIKKNHSGGTILIYTCIARVASLGKESMREFKFLSENLPVSNYVAACSGGEICPTLLTENKAINNEHNETLVACVF